MRSQRKIARHRFGNGIVRFYASAHFLVVGCIAALSEEEEHLG